MGVQPWPKALVLLCDTQEAELSAWLKEWTAACAALEGRDAQMARVAEALERDMQLLGATAVEDKLQVGGVGGWGWGGLQVMVAGKRQAGLRGWSGTSWGMV